MSAERPRVHIMPAGEPVLRFGPGDAPQLLMLQPLFEEMNRCRRLVATLCRALAARGVGCWLPDLPGTGESPRGLETVGWEAWQGCVAEVGELIARETGQAPLGVAIRGGALLDGGLTRRWRFAPVAGASLLADLRRSALAGGDPAAPAGYRLPDALAAALAQAQPEGDARTLRLASDERPADHHVEGPPLWRRPEPAFDADLAAALAADILEWVGTSGHRSC